MSPRIVQISSLLSVNNRWHTTECHYAPMSQHKCTHTYRQVEYVIEIWLWERSQTGGWNEGQKKLITDRGCWTFRPWTKLMKQLDIEGSTPANDTDMQLAGCQLAMNDWERYFLRYELFFSLNFGQVTDRQTDWAALFMWWCTLEIQWTQMDRQTDRWMESGVYEPTMWISTGVLNETTVEQQIFACEYYLKKIGVYTFQWAFTEWKSDQEAPLSKYSQWS